MSDIVYDDMIEDDPSDTLRCDLLERTTLNPADWMALARTLERQLNAAKAENTAMREAIKEAHDLVRWLVPNSDGLHHRTATAALSKLQPYLK